MQIREAKKTKKDYQSIENIWNQSHPEEPIAAKELEKDDKNRPKHIKYRRFITKNNGKDAGFVVFINGESNFHPKKFYLTLAVLPDYQGQGIGKALYLHALEALKEFDAIEIISWAREDYHRKNRFLLERDFYEVERSFESRLDVADFDFDNFDLPLPTAIEIKTWQELEKSTGYQRKIYDLHCSLDLDVPGVGEYTKPSFERFVQNHFDDERMKLKGSMIALHNGEYVGMHELYDSKADDFLHTGLTGVLRNYRKKGIALAMKLRGIEYAKNGKIAVISTWNESNNIGMLTINDKLGFKRQPASIDYAKDLTK